MKLRYFYDPGSGVCLWAGDDEAREKYGYPILLDALPLSESVVSIGQELIERFDTSIDWEYPSNPSPWTDEERNKFKNDCTRFRTQVVKELGPNYIIKNETK